LYITDAKGKERKKYRYEAMMTPYDKLKTLPDAIKLGETFELLDALAAEMSDNVAATALNKARKKNCSNLFRRHSRNARDETVTAKHTEHFNNQTETEPGSDTQIHRPSFRLISVLEYTYIAIILMCVSQKTYYPNHLISR
jgi:hypothetical protein